MIDRLISRVYPIRTTRNKWKIPLFCYHKCSDECNKIIVNLRKLHEHHKLTSNNSPSCQF